MDLRKHVRIHGPFAYSPRLEALLSMEYIPTGKVLGKTVIDPEGSWLKEASQGGFPYVKEPALKDNGVRGGALTFWCGGRL